MPPWVIAQLESWKKLIEAIEEQAAQNRSASCERGAPRRLIFGEGELTHELPGPRTDRPSSVSATVGRWATTLDSARVRARASSDDAWVRSPSTVNPGLRRLMVGTGLAGEPLSASTTVRMRRWGALLEDPKASAAARKKAIVAAGAPSGRRPLANGHRTSAGSKNLAWCKKSGSTETLFKEDPLP